MVCPFALVLVGSSDFRLIDPQGLIGLHSMSGVKGILIGDATGPGVGSVFGFEESSFEFQ